MTWAGYFLSLSLNSLLRKLKVIIPILDEFLQEKKENNIECCHWLLKGSAHMTV